MNNIVEYVQKNIKLNKAKHPVILRWIKSQNNFTRSCIFIIKNCIKTYGEKDLFEAIDEKYNKEIDLENV